MTRQINWPNNTCSRKYDRNQRYNNVPKTILVLLMTQFSARLCCRRFHSFFQARKEREGTGTAQHEENAVNDDILDSMVFLRVIDSALIPVSSTWDSKWLAPVAHFFSLL